MGRALLTIGLPVYNGEQFLEKTLNSILRQTFEDYQLIISDNASTDAIPEICEKYRKLDSRIKYIRHSQNHGAAFNYNFTFHSSNSKYFKWAAGDDILMPEFCEACVNYLNKNSDVSLAYTKYNFIDDKDKVMNSTISYVDVSSKRIFNRLKLMLRFSSRCNSVFGVIRGSALRKTKLIGNYSGQDYRLLAELAVLGKFELIDDVLFYRRIHQGACSSNPEVDFQKHWYDINPKIYSNFPELMLGFELACLTLKSPISFAEKIYCLYEIFNRLKNRRNRILKKFDLFFSGVLNLKLYNQGTTNWQSLKEPQKTLFGKKIKAK